MAELVGRHDEREALDRLMADVLAGAGRVLVLHGDAGARSPHEAYFFYWERGLQAVRSGQWKLHFPHDYRHFNGHPGNDGKAAGYVPAHTNLALYDLDADVGVVRRIETYRDPAYSTGGRD